MFNKNILIALLPIVLSFTDLTHPARRWRGEIDHARARVREWLHSSEALPVVRGCARRPALAWPLRRVTP